MKRLLVTAAFCLGSLAAASAIAQVTPQAVAPAHQHRTHHDPHKQAMQLGRKLGLSPDQTSRLEPIFAERQDQRNAIQQNTSLTPEQRRAQMRNLNHTMHQQLAAVLTPDQMQQLKSMHRQHAHQDQAQSAPSGV